jgi:ketosteroid isomerase-like protein
MWFTEDALTPIFICGVAALVMFWWWCKTSQKAFLQAGIGAVVLAGVIFLVERLIVTESERVEAAVVDIADAFRKKDVAGTLSHFSESAKIERALVAQASKMVDIEDDLRITDTNVQMSDDGTHATIRFRANATARYNQSKDRARTRWEFAFERQADEWKVTGIKRMHLIKDEYLDPLDPSDI